MDDREPYHADIPIDEYWEFKRRDDAYSAGVSFEEYEQMTVGEIEDAKRNTDFDVPFEDIIEHKRRQNAYRLGIPLEAYEVMSIVDIDDRMEEIGVGPYEEQSLLEKIGL